MKSLRFLPLAFLAGVDGFALFAPYAAFAVGLGLLLNLSWLLNGLALAVICLIIVGLHNAFDLMMWIARQV